MGRIILDLCGGTGAWSEPYRKAGYDVWIVSLPERDVRTYTPPAGVHGILAAPPCTEFAVSGARWWAKKPAHLLVEAREIVDACLRIIDTFDPVWWALENPVGRLKNWIGPWNHTFNPCDYGDPWTKRTCLWGKFTMPLKTLHACDHPCYPGHRLPPSPERATLRSITPQGFARAFFEANP